MQLKGDFCEIEQDHTLIAVYHGTNAKKKSLILQSGRYNVLVCGHTHKLEDLQVGKTILINPGTANGWFFGYKATGQFLIRQIENQNSLIYKNYLIYNPLFQLSPGSVFNYGSCSAF